MNPAAATAGWPHKELLSLQSAQKDLTYTTHQTLKLNDPLII